MYIYTYISYYIYIYLHILYYIYTYYIIYIHILYMYIIYIYIYLIIYIYIFDNIYIIYIYTHYRLYIYTIISPVCIIYALLSDPTSNNPCDLRRRFGRETRFSMIGASLRLAGGRGSPKPDAPHSGMVRCNQQAWFFDFGNVRNFQDMSKASLETTRMCTRYMRLD